MCYTKGLAPGRISRGSDLIGYTTSSKKITVQTKDSDISNMGHYGNNFRKIPRVSQQLVFRGKILSYNLQNLFFPQNST